MRQLRYGVRTFQHKVFPSLRDRFAELATGQRPPTLFITCSDSRIVPEMLTQTGPGELFVLRNAGNLVPPWTAEHTGEAATIEYAVQVLKVREIVVCGHSRCGAIQGLLNPASIEQLPAVKHWLTHAQDTIAELERCGLRADGTSGASDEDLWTAAIQCNVIAQLAHLRTYPAIAAAEQRGELSLIGWYYRFETGEVDELDSGAKTFVSIAEKEPEFIA